MTLEIAVKFAAAMDFDISRSHLSDKCVYVGNLVPLHAVANAELPVVVPSTHPDSAPGLGEHRMVAARGDLRYA